MATVDWLFLILGRMLIEPVRLLTSRDRWAILIAFRRGSTITKGQISPYFGRTASFRCATIGSSLRQMGSKGYRLKTLENLTLGVGRTVLRGVKLMLGSSPRLTVSSDPPVRLVAPGAVRPETGVLK